MTRNPAETHRSGNELASNCQYYSRCCHIKESGTAKLSVSDLYELRPYWGNTTLIYETIQTVECYLESPCSHKEEVLLTWNGWH